MREKPVYLDIQRTLAMLRQLQHAPSTKADLMEYVLIEVGADAYADEPKRAGKQFERDIDRLRSWGVNIVTEPGHTYRLVSYGEFSPVSLTDDELSTVAFLLETFAPGAPQAEAVQELLQRLLDWIPVGQRSAIGLSRQRLRMDLRRRDDDFIPAVVQTAVEKAVEDSRRFPDLANGIVSRLFFSLAAEARRGLRS